MFYDIIIHLLCHNHFLRSSKLNRCPKQPFLAWPNFCSGRFMSECVRFLELLYSSSHPIEDCAFGVTGCIIQCYISGAFSNYHYLFIKPPTELLKIEHSVTVFMT